MWCASCQADVVGQVSSDNRRILCCGCQAILSEVHSSAATAARPTSSDSVRSARELLSKWSAEIPGTIRRVDEPERAGPVAQPAKTTAATVNSAAAKGANAGKGFDGDSSIPGQDSGLVYPVPSLNSHDTIDRDQFENSDQFEQEPSAAESPSMIERVANPSPVDDIASEMLDEEHAIPVDEDTAIPVDELDSCDPVGESSSEFFPYMISDASFPSATPTEIPAAASSSESLFVIRRQEAAAKARQSSQPELMRNWTILGGQICAFLGAGLMSIGTGQVVVGLFLSPPHILPGAWLMTTLGQLLLLLGVVTLISGGLEETSAEVAHTIDRLVTRIDQLEANLPSADQSPDQANRTAA